MNMNCGIESIVIRRYGGKGSGNIGHSGRPGQVGGSSSRIGGTTKVKLPKVSELTKKQLDELVEENWIKFTQTEKGTIQFYTQSGYKFINKPLRKGTKFSDEIGEHIGFLESAIKKSNPLKENIITYRQSTINSLGIDNIIFQGNNAKKLIGKVVQDDGFCSTAAFGKYSKTDELGGGVIFNIRVPKNKRVLFIGNRSKIGIEDFEILLPRKSKFKIIDAIIKRDSNNLKYLSIDCGVI